MVISECLSKKFRVGEYLVVFFLSANSLSLWVRVAQLLFKEYSLVVTGAKLIITVLMILSVVIGIIGMIKYRKFELFLSILLSLAVIVLKVFMFFSQTFDDIDYFCLRIVDIVINFCFISCAINFLLVLRGIDFEGFDF